MQCGAGEVGITAMRHIERAGRHLRDATSARGHELKIDIVGFEPAQFLGDILRPLRRPVRDHAGGDRGLRLCGAGG